MLVFLSTHLISKKKQVSNTTGYAELTPPSLFITGICMKPLYQSARRIKSPSFSFYNLQIGMRCGKETLKIVC